MPHSYLDQEHDAEVVIYDENDRVIKRFVGHNSLSKAMHWAQRNGFELRANINPVELVEHYRVLTRRRPRFLRLLHKEETFMNRQDPTNVKRIVIDDDDDWFEIELED